MSWKVAVAGCGWIAPFQLEGWRRIEGVTVAGVCDHEPERARRLAEQYGVRWAGADAAEMLEACRPDIIDVATTPASHFAIVREAAARGVHILCQKPTALTLEEAGAMIAAAERAGVAIYINEMLRFCPWFRKAREVVAAGRIGRPVYARLHSRMAGFLEVGPERAVAYGFRSFLRDSGRVLMLEETIHYLDVARFLLGEPSSLYAAATRASRLIRGEDIATLVLRFGDAVVAIDDSWSSHGPARSGLEIEGEEGALLLTHDKRLELHSGRTGAVEESWDYSQRSWPEWRPLVFEALFRDFLDAVAARPPSAAQAHDNLRTLRLALAAYESSSQNRVIELAP
jgi:predicted dehydrogenase